MIKSTHWVFYVNQIQFADLEGKGPSFRSVHTGNERCETPAALRQVRGGGWEPGARRLLLPRTSTLPCEPCAAPSRFLCSLSALLITLHPFLCDTTRPT